MSGRNVPVYIVTGFLESGKTKFVSEMLADDGRLLPRLAMTILSLEATQNLALCLKRACSQFTANGVG